MVQPHVLNQSPTPVEDTYFNDPLQRFVPSNFTREELAEIDKELNPEHSIANVYVVDGTEPDNSFMLEGVYAHGRLADDMEYDVICFDKKISEGLHLCKYGPASNYKLCKLFLWKKDYGHRIAWRGLCCYTDDTEYLTDALEKYSRKAAHI